MFRQFLVAVTVLVIGSNGGTSTELSFKKRLKREIKKSNEITVMVIDTGIDTSHELLKNRIKSDGSSNYQDRHGHGTHVAGIILYGNHMQSALGTKDELCSEVKIISCKYYDPIFKYNNLEKSVECVKKATKMKVDYVNYSGGGSEFSKEEYEAYKEYTDGGGIAILAAGNDASDLNEKEYYPASYGLKYKLQRMYPVMNIDQYGTRVPSSNYHSLAFREVGLNIYSTLPGNSYGTMTGTSQAAPAILHTLLKQRCIDLYQKR